MDNGRDIVARSMSQHWRRPLSRRRECRCCRFILSVECLHTLDSDFKRFGKSSCVRETIRTELLLQLVSSELVDCSAQLLGVFFDRIDYARKHKREFNALGDGGDGVLAFRFQFFRAHEFLISVQLVRQAV